MADDLDNFFAKKAAKKSKKVLSQDTDVLARRLEKAVRQQEHIDRCRGEEERILKERIQAVEQQNVQEDSEWLDVEPEVVVDPTAAGLQELNIEEIEEDNKSVNDERIEKPKTWNLHQDKENSVEAADVQETKVEAPKAYVPPSVRIRQATKVSVLPNLQDSLEFPSLSAAEDLSKLELVKKKASTARKEKEIREREKDDKRKKDSESKIEESKKDATPAPAPVSTTPKYLPPHLRMK